jgi:hypothetical protein
MRMCATCLKWISSCSVKHRFRQRALYLLIAKHRNVQFQAGEDGHGELLSTVNTTRGLSNSYDERQRGVTPGFPPWRAFSVWPRPDCVRQRPGSSRFYLSTLYKWRSHCATYSITRLVFILEEEVSSYLLRRGVSGPRIVLKA